VDFNASYFTCFSSGSSSPEVAEFCPTLRLVYFIARAQASACALSSVYSLPCDNICALSSFYSLPCNNFVQKVVPQVKKLILFVTAFKDLYVSHGLFRKKIAWSLFHRQLSHQAQGMCFHVRFLRFLLHSATTPVALQHGVYSFIQPLSWERQQGNGVLGFGSER
jgi:hypothetical protein